MSSANVFLKMNLLAPEPATPVRLLQHASGRRPLNGQSPIRAPNGEPYVAFKGISTLA
jgi:hypothetical protein